MCLNDIAIIQNNISLKTINGYLTVFPCLSAHSADMAVIPNNGWYATSNPFMKLPLGQSRCSLVKMSTTSRIPSNFSSFFDKGKTFRPKKKFQPGTLKYSLHKQAQASLNSGINLRSVRNFITSITKCLPVFLYSILFNK